MLDLVLLIDDDDTTNFLNKRLLEEMEVAKEILVYNNGKDAIEYLSDACSDNNTTSGKICPDLIFLDIKMPVMDGFSFLDEYQTRQLDSKDHVIIMMLTSSASFYDLERLKNYSRVKKHYSKTLTKHDVQEVLNQFFARK